MAQTMALTTTMTPKLATTNTSRCSSCSNGGCCHHITSERDEDNCVHRRQGAEEKAEGREGVEARRTRSEMLARYVSFSFLFLYSFAPLTFFLVCRLRL